MSTDRLTQIFDHYFMDIEFAIKSLKSTLCTEVDVGCLFARSQIAHKWKAPWRSLLLRESVAWRIQELLAQSLSLSKSDGLLGARILLRSAFETLAVLVYLNKSMRSVVNGNLTFDDFSKKTSLLLLGSRDNSTSHVAIGVLTVLDSADKRYPGLRSWYNDLFESAHPNCEGLLGGYSLADQENHVTTFASRWSKVYGHNHDEALHACLVVFEAEYNHEWTDAWSALEQWIEVNDSQIQVTKPLQPDAS
jgi:hypothetical protein